MSKLCVYEEAAGGAEEEKKAGGTKMRGKNHQLLTPEPRFVRKGCRRTNQTRKKNISF